MNEWMNEWNLYLFSEKKHKYHDKIKMLKKKTKTDPIRVKSYKNVKTVKNT